MVRKKKPRPLRLEWSGHGGFVFTTGDGRPFKGAVMFNHLTQRWEAAAHIRGEMISTVTRRTFKDLKAADPRPAQRWIERCFSEHAVASFVAVHSGRASAHLPIRLNEAQIEAWAKWRSLTDEQRNTAIDLVTRAGNLADSKARHKIGDWRSEEIKAAGLRQAYRVLFTFTVGPAHKR